MAFFSEALAKIEDCVELIENDKCELKYEIQNLREELDSTRE